MTQTLKRIFLIKKIIVIKGFYLHVGDSNARKNAAASSRSRYRCTL